MKGFMKKNGFKDLCFVLISLFFLTIGFFINPSKIISQDGQYNFDYWSNDIMISDLMYDNNFETDSLFLKSISPPVLEEYTKKDDVEGMLPKMFYDNKTFPKELFRSYTSNITIHRYIYSFLENILPFSNRVIINAFYLLNSILMACAVTIVLFWIKRKTNYLTSYCMVFLLSFVTPLFTMYGRNLYWVGWTLFLPMCTMILLLQYRRFIEFSHKRKICVLSFAAFAACLIKQLCYFEFVTTVMIAMMIPVIYYIFENKLSFRKGASLFAFPSVAAVLSLLLVNVIKFVMLVIEYGTVSKAWTTISDNLFGRLVSDGNSTSLITLGKTMSLKTVYSLKYVAAISVIALITLTISIMIVDLLPYLRAKKVYLYSRLPLLICTAISLLAPISWFVLAKPHTMVHHTHCAITWFIPYGILATAYIIDFFIRIISKHVKSIQLS